MTIAQRFSPDIPVLTIDPFDEAVLRDPEPYYAKLREAGPLVNVEKYGILACGRFKETQEIFADWTRFVSSRGVGLSDFKAEKPWRQPSIILEADPPKHSRTRNVMARAMSPHAVARLKDRFSEEAESLIDRLLEKREFDAVRDLAEAFPLKVFPDAVGIASEGRENLLAYGNMVFNAVGPDNPVRRKAFANAPAIAAWIAQHCDRKAITSDGFAATIYAAADSGELTEQEAGLLVRSLLSAGVDTTVAGLGSAMFCFATNPDQYALLRDNPQLARQAFEEVLRFTSPCTPSAGPPTVIPRFRGSRFPRGVRSFACWARRTSIPRNGRMQASSRLSGSRRGISPLAPAFTAASDSRLPAVYTRAGTLRFQPIADAPQLSRQQT